MICAGNCRLASANSPYIWFSVLECIFTVSKHTCPVSKNQGSESSFCFLQYMNVVSLKEVVAKEMGCTKLRWSRDTQQEECYTKHRDDLDPGKWFGKTSTWSIFGLVSIVPAEGEERYPLITLVAKVPIVSYRDSFVR